MARKAILKRIRITKNGIMMHRREGQNHFNAKSSRKAQQRQKKSAYFSKTVEKKMKVYLQK